MTDYPQAAAELKARLDAKNKKIADYHDFWEDLRNNLLIEAEKANSALTYQDAPKIDSPKTETYEGAPNERVTQFTLGTATSIIHLDQEKHSIAALIKGESGEKTVTYLIDEEQSPLTASRVSISPANEPKIAPAAIAESFIEALITGAP